MDNIKTEEVSSYFKNLQNSLCAEIEALDPEGSFREDSWNYEVGGGLSRIFEEGKVFEKAGINFSDIEGKKLPPSATALRPELKGRGFRAMGLSLVFHPLNPFVPTTHMNVRLVMTKKNALNGKQKRRPRSTIPTSLPFLPSMKPTARLSSPWNLSKASPCMKL